jgi:hypothetical protein
LPGVCGGGAGVGTQLTGQTTAPYARFRPGAATSKTIFYVQLYARLLAGQSRDKIPAEQGVVSWPRGAIGHV